MSEWEIKLSQARDRLPLRRMMQERGKSVPSDKRNFKCPYCSSDSASLFHPNGARNEMFKCFSTKCPTGTSGEGAAWDEVKFLAYETGTNSHDAYIQYLKEAGVWTEQERTAPSVMPGSRARKRKPPTPPSPEKTKTESPAEPPPAEPPAPTVPPVPSPMSEPAVESAPVPATEVDDKGNESEGPFTPVETNDGGVLGQMVLEDFYSRLTLSPEDERALWSKRALTTATCLALGFVSSPESNREILLELAAQHTWDELSASGLWLPENKQNNLARRPNAQFYGLGQKGKKPKENRRDKNDRWIWGMVHPVLIPYFNELGKIVKLRPHKGGAPANTLCGASRIYVPRDFRRAADIAETFFKVVICEGDFKAAALWQVLGAGRDDSREPIGVCAIPGINFASNFDLREELEAWLRSVQCRQVIVAFDSEDKSDKPLRDRHEAVIWARYLATDLARKLHIAGKVCVLPAAWRDANRKADWDGALAKFVHQPEGDPK